jgi:hypothetical protein
MQTRMARVPCKHTCRCREPLAEVVARCEESWLLESLTVRVLVRGSMQQAHRACVWCPTCLSPLQAAMQGDAGARGQVGTMLLAGYGARKEGDEAGRWVRHAWAIQNYRRPAEVEEEARDGPQGQGQEERAGSGGDGGGCSRSGRGGGSVSGRARTWCARTLRRGASPQAAALAASARGRALVPPEPGGAAVAAAAAAAVSLRAACGDSVGSISSEPSSEAESDGAAAEEPSAAGLQQRGGAGGSDWAWAAMRSSSRLLGLGLDVARCARSGATGHLESHAAGRQPTRDGRQPRRASAGALVTRTDSAGQNSCRHIMCDAMPATL